MQNSTLAYTTPAIERFFLPPDVHQLRREQADGIGLAFILALTLGAGHALNLMLTLGGTLPIAGGVIFHLLLVGIAGALTRAAVRTGRDVRFLALLFVTSAALGVFGAVGTALAIALYQWFSRSSLSFAEWFGSIFPRVQETRAQRVFNELTLGRDESDKSYSVIPFMDVLTVGSEAQKRQALARMTSRFHHSFAPAFRRALADPSNAIRVQAATAIAKIEHAFTDRLLKLSRLKEQMPGNAAITLALAEHYDHYAFTGIMDPEREAANREKALGLYLEYLKQHPGNAEIRTHVGRLMLRSGEYARAADWFERCLAEGISTEGLLLWYWEALFRAGRYAKLRESTAMVKQMPEKLTALHPGLADAVALWTNGGKIASEAA